eukprot:5772024-Pleurochrysis_carterae.AAC.1
MQDDFTRHTSFRLFWPEELTECSPLALLTETKLYVSRPVPRCRIVAVEPVRKCLIRNIDVHPANIAAYGPIRPSESGDGIMVMHHSSLVAAQSLLASAHGSIAGARSSSAALRVSSAAARGSPAAA